MAMEFRFSAPKPTRNRGFRRLKDDLKRIKDAKRNAPIEILKIVKEEHKEIKRKVRAVPAEKENAGLVLEGEIIPSIQETIEGPGHRVFDPSEFTVIDPRANFERLPLSYVRGGGEYEKHIRRGMPIYAGADDEIGSGIWDRFRGSRFWPLRKENWFDPEAAERKWRAAAMFTGGVFLGATLAFGSTHPVKSETIDRAVSETGNILNNAGKGVWAVINPRGKAVSENENSDSDLPNRAREGTGNTSRIAEPQSPPLQTPEARPAALINSSNLVTADVKENNPRFFNETGILGYESVDGIARGLILKRYHQNWGITDKPDPYNGDQAAILNDYFKSESTDHIASQQLEALQNRIFIETSLANPGNKDAITFMQDKNGREILVVKKSAKVMIPDDEETERILDRIAGYYQRAA
jgi:hypothetical protein